MDNTTNGNRPLVQFDTRMALGHYCESMTDEGGSLPNCRFDGAEEPSRARRRQVHSVSRQLGWWACPEPRVLPPPDMRVLEAGRRVPDKRCSPRVTEEAHSHELVEGVYFILEVTPG